MRSMTISSIGSCPPGDREGWAGWSRVPGGALAEAAGTIAFLASDDAGFITAAALPLDGGITEAFTVPE
jgi:NAD(P)-dependent dehydrogenase (short-subunit alcohol dehydrogenase family)